MVWRHKAIDCDDFNDTKKINMDKTLQNEFSYCESVKLGHFLIDTQSVIQLGWKIGRSQYKQLFQHSEFKAPVDPDGVWTYNERENMIRRSKVEGEDSIGDLKVTYETINGFCAEENMNVSAIGQ